MINWLAENGASISRASIIICLCCIGFQTYRLFLWMRTEFEALRDQVQRISFSHTKTEPEHKTIAVRVVPESEYHVLTSQAGIAEEMNHPRFLMKVPKESDFFRKPCVHDPDHLPNGQSRQRSHLEPSRRVSHAQIRRVSIDKFYEIVTGDSEAFLKICLALPGVVQDVLSERDSEVTAPHDTVYEEMLERAGRFQNVSDDAAMIMAMYMLGFGTYNGFAVGMIDSDVEARQKVK